MSEFVSFLDPPRDALKGYDHRQRHNAQAHGIPEVFRDAMSVREEVFVDEQHTPLVDEFDYDDARCYHWVAYASVGTTNPSENDSKQSNNERGQYGRRKSSTANKVAIGTIRLVPPPHPPHPQPGSSHKIDNAEQEMPYGAAEVNRAGQDQTKSGQEPYIKLGRLAVLNQYRGEPIPTCTESQLMSSKVSDYRIYS